MKVRHSDDHDSNISFQIAPMVDVVFILMLFFMSSAAMQVREQELSTNMPGTAASPDDAPPMTLEIQVSANGLIAAGAQDAVAPVDSPTDTELNELQSKVKFVVERDREKHAIIVNPDGDALHQRIMDVLNACVKAGAKNISFSG